MKTSRVAQETAKVVRRITEAPAVPRRHTRSFAASLQAFSADNSPLKQEVKTEDDASDTVPSTPNSPDIEDLPFDTPVTKKRKREIETPSTAATTISTTTSTRTSPRKGPAARRVKKARRQPAKRIVKDDGTVDMESPANWEEVYSTTQQMRKMHLAPVDTMGCERIADPKVSAKVCPSAYA